jgi:hypothetical protein
MTQTRHLAQLNIGRIRYEIDEKTARCASNESAA